MYFLAIDIGASSGRHILGSLQNGKLVLEEIYRFSNNAVLKNGHLTWDVDALFNDIIHGLKLAKDKSPAYVGIDTWAVDYALLKGGKRLDDVFCYRDSRTAKAIDCVHSAVSFDDVYAKTGIQFQPFNTIYQLYADKLSGKLDQADEMLMLPDYLGYLLTGEKRQEYTNATTTSLVNAKTHTWDGELIEKLGFSQKLFKRLVQPGNVLGKLRSELVAEIGYSPIVVQPATHDTASAVLAMPTEGSPYVSSGTWSLLGIERNVACFDGKKFNYSNEGSLSYRFRFQKNVTGLWLIQQIKRELNDEFSYSQLAEMAQSSDFSKTFDANDSVFLSPQSMTKEIERAVGQRLSVKDLANCVFRSLAKCYADSLTQMEKVLGEKYDTLNVFGGGCQNSYLNKLTAEATEKRVVVGPVEATAAGNVIVQMMSCGELGSLSDARKTVKNSFDIKEVC